MLGFVVFVLVHFLLDAPQSQQAWRDWVAVPGVSLVFVLFIAALLTHAWVGLRDVTLDYVAPLAPRLAVLSLIAAALLAVAAEAAQLLLRLHG